jgi:hypothetical protein
MEVMMPMTKVWLCENLRLIMFIYAREYAWIIEVIARIL